MRTPELMCRKDLICCQAIKKLLAKDTAPGWEFGADFRRTEQDQKHRVLYLPLQTVLLARKKNLEVPTVSKTVLKRGIGFQSARWYDKSHTDLAERGLRVSLPKFRDMW